MAPVVCTFHCNTRVYIYVYIVMHIQPSSLSIPKKFRSRKKTEKSLKHKCSHIQTHAHCCFQYSGWTYAHSTLRPSHLFLYHPSPSLHFYLSFSYPLSRILDFPPTIYPSKALPLFTHPSYFFFWVPFKFSISQLKLRLPPTIHTCSWHHVSQSLYPIYSTLFLYFSLPTSPFLTFLILYICRLEGLVCRHKGIQCS